MFRVFIIFIVYMVCLALLVFLVEMVRVNYHFPVTLMDLIFFPMSVVIIVLSPRWLFSKDEIKHRVNKINTKMILAKFVVFSVITIPSGIFVAGLGISHPFDYFSGVKWSSHGYTLASCGILILMGWVYVARMFLRVWVSGRSHKK